MIQKLVLLIFLNSIFSISSEACSCMPTGTVEQEVTKAEIVVVARILDKTIITMKDLTESGAFEFQKAIYSLSITRIYKGKFASDTIKLVTGLGAGDCGYNFQIGKDYIIYGIFGKNDQRGSSAVKYLETNICTRTRPYEKIEAYELQKVIKRCIKN